MFFANLSEMQKRHNKNKKPVSFDVQHKVQSSL